MSYGRQVDNKGNQQWVWLALDTQTREIVGVHIGDRSAVSAIALWNSMPPVYRQCAVIYTDHWSAYDSVLPTKRHRSVDKDSGCTSYIERFNCTLRQRVSRRREKELIQLLEIGKSYCFYLAFCASL